MLDPLPSLEGLDSFPLPESATLEFKQTLGAAKEKLTKTVCSFLNNRGGYYVVGVRDAGHIIVGVEATTEQIDGFLLAVDNIYHLEHILDEFGNRLEPGEVEGSVIQLSSEKKLVVVTVRPSGNKTYRTKDGNVYYRLGASVYTMREGSLERRTLEMKEEIKKKDAVIATLRSTMGGLNREKKLLEDLLAQSKGLLKAQRNQFETVCADAQKLAGAAKDAEAKTDAMLKALEVGILAQKAEVEEALAAEAQRPWWRCWA